MKSKQQMREEIININNQLGIHPGPFGTYCQSARDGECNFNQCPRDERSPHYRKFTHCPLDIHTEERGYQ